MNIMMGPFTRTKSFTAPHSLKKLTLTENNFEFRSFQEGISEVSFPRFRELPNSTD